MGSYGLKPFLNLPILKINREFFYKVEKGVRQFHLESLQNHEKIAVFLLQKVLLCFKGLKVCAHYAKLCNGRFSYFYAKNLLIGANYACNL